MQFSAAKRMMYDFKNSLFPNFLLTYRAKYIFSRDIFCLYHFRAKIHGVYCTFFFIGFSVFELNFWIRNTVAEERLGRKHASLHTISPRKKTASYPLITTTLRVLWLLQSSQYRVTFLFFSIAAPKMLPDPIFRGSFLNMSNKV